MEEGDWSMKPYQEAWGEVCKLANSNKPRAAMDAVMNFTCDCYNSRDFNAIEAFLGYVDPGDVKEREKRHMVLCSIVMAVKDAIGVKGREAFYQRMREFLDQDEFPAGDVNYLLKLKPRDKPPEAWTVTHSILDLPKVTC